MKLHPHTVVGEPELCAWAVAPGVCWIQTRRHEFAEMLRKRSDTARVLWAVRGPYLVTFAINRPLKFVGKLVRRYIRNLHAANDPISGLTRPTNALESAGGI
jgi:hypothetical protein